MEKKSTRILKTALSLGLAAALLWWCFRGIGWSDFLEGLRSCRWEFVLLSMLFGALPLLLRGFRWRMLLLPIDPSLRARDCIHAGNICMLVNLVLPRVGEVVRCGYITRHSAPDEKGRKKASFDKVFGTVLVDRLWDTVFIALLLLAFLALLWQRFGSFFLEKVLGPASARLGVLWILPGVALAAVLFLWLLWRLRERNPFFGKVWGFFRGIGSGLQSCLQMRRGWLFLVYTVLVWLCYWMAVQGTIWAIPALDSLTPVDGFFLMMVGAVSSLVPVPGGFGAYHYLLMLTLQTMYGVPAELGLVFATLAHESQTLVQILCGGTSYLIETFSSSEN